LTVTFNLGRRAHTRAAVLWVAFGLAAASACKTRAVGNANQAPRDTATGLAGKAVTGGPGVLLGDGPFEGEIAFDVRRGEVAGKAVYRVKGARVRLEIGPNGGAEGGSIVYDAEHYTGAVYGADGGIVLPLGARGAAPQEQNTKAKIERTGATATVAGLICEIWKVQEKARSIDACVVEGVAWGSNYAQLVTWLPKGKFFVLRAIERDSSGAETTRVEATRVERRTQTEALFNVPDAPKDLDAGAK
jgi:hypothetical protein